MNVVIWDLDGTLADGRHRLHLLPSKADSNKTEGWLEFNKASKFDLPFVENIKLMNTLFDAGLKSIIVTGRSDHVIDDTQEWLYRHGCKYHKLIMRSKDDNRKDTEFKEEVLREIGLSNILCAFDDLEHIAKHFRSLGITCHLVTHYDEKRIDNVSRDERKELK